MMEQQFHQALQVMVPDQAEETEALAMKIGVEMELLPEEIFNSIVIKQWDLVRLGPKHFKERWKK